MQLCAIVGASRNEEPQSMRVSVLGNVIAALLLCAVCTGALAQDPGRAAQDGGRPAGQDTGGVLTLPGGDANFDPNQPIRPGMSVSLSVSSAAGPEADLSGVFQVDPTGSIQLKLVGMVPLRGLTPTQAADKIAAQLKPYIRDPKVSVTIVSVPKPVVFLAGGVTRPGAVLVSDTTTLAEMLTIAGYSENADLSRVRVTRRDEKGNRTVTEYNLLKWLKPAPGQAPDESQNPLLTDRDSVYVTVKTLPGTGNISVEGDVLKPGTVSTRVGVPLTLREAVSLAGGPTPTADRREIAVRRLGVERPIVVDYDKMEAGDPTHNIEVQSDDVVYVRRLAIDQYVSLNGGFVKPGKLAYQRTLTLTEAIAEAGGLLPVGKAKDGRIFRHINGAGDPTQTQIIAFNYNDIRKNKQPDIRLEPGDTVEVPLGEPPRPAMDPLQVTSTVLSIALIIDSLFRGRRYPY